MRALEDRMDAYSGTAAVLAAEDEDSLDAQYSALRLGGDHLNLQRIHLHRTGLELERIARPGRPPLFEELAGARWLQCLLTSTDRGHARRLTLRVGGLMPLFTCASYEVAAMEGALFREAELVRCEDESSEG